MATTNDQERMLTGTSNYLRSKGWAKGVTASFIRKVIKNYNEHTTFRILALAVAKEWAAFKHLGTASAGCTYAYDLETTSLGRSVKEDWVEMQGKVLAQGFDRQILDKLTGFYKGTTGRTRFHRRLPFGAPYGSSIPKSGAEILNDMERVYQGLVTSHDYSLLERRVLTHLIATPDPYVKEAKRKLYHSMWHLPPLIIQYPMKIGNFQEMYMTQQAKPESLARLRERKLAAQVNYNNAITRRREAAAEADRAQRTLVAADTRVATTGDELDQVGAQLAARELTEAKALFSRIHESGTSEQKADIDKFLAALGQGARVGNDHIIHIRGNDIQLVYREGTAQQHTTTGFPTVEEAQRWARGRSHLGPNAYKAGAWFSGMYPDVK